MRVVTSKLHIGFHLLLNFNFNIIIQNKKKEKLKKTKQNGQSFASLSTPFFFYLHTTIYLVFFFLKMYNQIFKKN